MNDEPVYVDVDESGDGWRYPTTEFDKKILSVTGRKYFPTEALANSVHRIQRNKAYSDIYLEELLDWAKKKNATITIITLKNLVSAIRNPDNLARHNQMVLGHEDRTGYADTISW
jgi:hypothetical protein